VDDTYRHCGGWSQSKSEGDNLLLREGFAKYYVELLVKDGVIADGAPAETPAEDGGDAPATSLQDVEVGADATLVSDGRHTVRVVI